MTNQRIPVYVAFGTDLKLSWNVLRVPKDGRITLQQILLVVANKKWTQSDVVQGIFAACIYTFEVKKLPRDQTDDVGKSKSSKWPSHYGYVNAKLREYFNPLSNNNVDKTLQNKYKALLSPFVTTLQNFLLECLPPVGTLLTFRGIDALVARNYNTNEYFIWSAFSSTSKDAKVAMEFGDVGKKQGSFFQLQVSSGRDISQFSMFPKEAE
eukprot:PhF_6_TR10513/c1_g1_i1/m.16564